LIVAEADAIERGRRLTEPVVEELHQARLFRMLYPRSVGGDEGEPAVYIDAVGELARADGSVGWCTSIANSTGLFAPYLEPEAARTVFGPPRATCAWGPPNECRGIAVPGGYRVTGRWDFASGCRHASWMGAHGTVVEADGSLHLNNFGRPKDIVQRVGVLVGPGGFPSDQLDAERARDPARDLVLQRE
jgi:alkylation response protein AidB-like acyl-CoA dehydrogenase